MEDSNLMTVNKYIPNTTGPVKKDSGYNSDTRQSIESSFLDVQTTVDMDSENFKYGLDYWSGTLDNKLKDPLFLFQDPLLPTVDIILDTARSPLFITDTGSPFYQNSLAGFLDVYGDIQSIGARQKIHGQFLKTLYTLFNTEFNQIDRNKSYYINSIAGLDKLTARIVDFEKDKITLNFNEDVSMISAYVAQLHNNLAYSYRDQRHMIPANLLRFNMYIKVHDVRNMYFYKPDGGTGSTLSFDKSYMIYFLRDCSFEFKKAKSFDDTITVGGFEAGAPSKPASISFDVVYKSIEIESEYPLIMDSLELGVSSALKINNKDNDVLAYEDGLNSVFKNNYKSPGAFTEQLTNDAKLNNDRDIGIASAKDAINANNADAEMKKNYKFGVVSSDAGNNTREKDIKGLPRPQEPAVDSVAKSNPKWKSALDSDTTFKVQQDNKINELNNRYVSDSVINYNGIGVDPTWKSVFDVEGDSQGAAYEVRRLIRDEILKEENRVIEGDVIFNGVGLDPTWKTAAQSDTTFEIQYNYKTSILNDRRLYEPSVFNDEWNYTFANDDTGPALTAYRDSILNQLNLEGWLMFGLPESIMNIFFGHFHGMNPAFPNYIRTDEASLPIMVEDRKNPKPINEFPEKPLVGTSTPPWIPPVRLEGVSEPVSIEPVRLEGVSEPVSFEPDRLNGEHLEINPHPIQPFEANIDTSFHNQPPLDAHIDVSFKPHIVDVMSIDTHTHPKELLSGKIDTSFKLHTVDLGSIDTTAKPQDDLSGYIDTSFKPRVVDIGVIDTSAKVKPILSGSIDTTAKDRIVNMGSLYENVYNKRNVNLGLLYVGITNDNILPITYLYTKTDKFNNLLNYHVYNNFLNESKSLNNISIDQTIRDIKPLGTIYDYDNNIDIKKTLTEITLYNNNVDKVNNLNVININNDIIPKPGLVDLKLYDNVVVDKTLPEIYLYDKIKDIKSLDNVHSYRNLESDRIRLDKEYISIETKTPIVTNLGNVIEETRGEIKVLDMGKLYEPSTDKKLLEPINLFESVKVKTIDLGKIYDNEYKQENLFVNKIIVEKDEKIGKKEIEITRLDQTEISEKTIERKYITDDEIKDKKSLNGDNVNEVEWKKEKDGLDNERLR